MTAAEYKSHDHKKKFLETLFQNGAPDIIEADNEFSSFREFFKENGVTLRLGKPYAWKTQATVESLNRVLQQRIRPAQLDRSANLDKDIKRIAKNVTFALNNMTLPALDNYTPFYIHHGREPRQTMSLLDRAMVDSILKKETTPVVDIEAPPSKLPPSSSVISVDKKKKKKKETKKKDTSTSKKPWSGAPREAYLFKKNDMIFGIYEITSPYVVEIKEHAKVDGIDMYTYSILDEAGDFLETEKKDIRSFHKELKEIVKDMKKRQEISELEQSALKAFGRNGNLKGNRNQSSSTRHQLPINTMAFAYRREEVQTMVKVLSTVSNPRTYVYKVYDPIENKWLRNQKFYNTEKEFHENNLKVLKELLEDDLEIGTPLSNLTSDNEKILQTLMDRHHIPIKADTIAYETQQFLERYAKKKKEVEQSGGSYNRFVTDRNKSSNGSNRKVNEMWRKTRDKQMKEASVDAVTSQGLLKIGDFVRLHNQARDQELFTESVYPYKKYNSTTIGKFYREWAKNPIGFKQLKTRKIADPYVMRHQWSREVFLVTRVYFKNMRKVRKYIPNINLNDISMRELILLGRHSIAPLVELRRVNIKPGQRHINLQELRTSPDFDSFLGPIHPKPYLRRDILRIPQDTLHTTKFRTYRERLR